MTTGFYHDNEIHKFTHVNVGYDKAQRAIYFNFRTVDNKNKDIIPGGFLKITKDKKGTSAKIAALALFNRNNLNVKDCAGKYPYHFIKDPKYGGLFYIKFDEKNKVQQ